MGFYPADTMATVGRRHAYVGCEHINGDNVRREIEEAAGLSIRASFCGLLVGLLCGVNRLHDLLMLHCDIEPTNVVLRGGD
jgi:tRNA A-37 threonylcarbamoyl transferase component Bud32